MMLNSKISSLIISMAVPSMIAYIINSVYSLTDTYFVSMLGTNATAAVSVNSSLDSFVFMFSSALAVGSNSFVSRLLGARQKKRADEVISTGFFTCILVGLVIMAVGLIFIYPMIRLFGATDTCEEYAVDYARFVLIAAPFTCATSLMTMCLRGEGRATLSMVGTVVGAVVNIGLDPVFIFVLNMGVAGASLATAISKVVSFVVLFTPYLLKKTNLVISIRHFKPSFALYGEVLKVGGSSAVRSLLTLAASIVTNNIAGGYSDSVLAAVGVSHKIMLVPIQIALGLSAGVQPVVGFNWGARRFDRVRKSFWFSTWLSLGIGTLMAVILIVFAEPIISLFTVADEELIEFGVLTITLQSIALPGHVWAALSNGFNAGSGDLFGAFFVSSSRQGFCYLPFIHLACYLFGETGLAGIQAAADVMALIPTALMARRVFRRMERIEAEEAVPSKAPAASAG